eukprot:jgi/Galph1/3424/GphlegSOOS_G2092.1
MQCTTQTQNVSNIPSVDKEKNYEIIEQQQLSGSKLNIQVQVNGEKTRQCFEKHLMESSKKTMVPGFRKGKVPRPILINHLGSTVAAKACKELIQDTVRQVLMNENITALSTPMLVDNESELVRSFQAGQPLSFRFTFEAYPKVEFLQSYKGLFLRVPQENFQESMIDETLKELQMRNAELVPLEGNEETVGEKHVVLVDIAAYHANPDGSKGVPLADLVSESEAEVDMEKGQYVDGLKEGLLGSRVGDTVSIPLKFPDNAKQEKLRGISAIFDIHVKGLKQRQLAPLDDKLVMNCTSCSSLEEFRQRAKEQLEIEVQKANERHLKKAIEDALVEIVQVDVPEQIAEEHSRQKFARLMSEMKGQGVDEQTLKNMVTKERYEKYKQDTWSTTLRELKVWFAINEIAKRENIHAPEEQVLEELEQIKAEMKNQKVNGSKFQ